MSKFTPERMCVACRKSYPKNSLMRFVLDENGELFCDRNQKAEGRGTYLCKNDACVKRCVKYGLIGKAFRKNLPDEAYRTVEEEYDGLQKN